MPHYGPPPSEEERLVARCLQSEDTAWETMFHLYHPKLVFVIKSMIQGESGMEQAEEIAASVWSSLCSEGYSRLRRYDPHAGRLLGYLACLARREIWRARARSEEPPFSRMHGCSPGVYLG